MNYFDYLSYTNKKDTRDNFIQYLVEVMGYTEDVAIKESEIYYGGIK